MSKLSPIVNIHQTGQRRWVTSFQYEGDEDVCLIDSDIGKKADSCMTDSLKCNWSKSVAVGRDK